MVGNEGAMRPVPTWLGSQPLPRPYLLEGDALAIATGVLGTGAHGPVLVSRQDTALCRRREGGRCQLPRSSPPAPCVKLLGQGIRAGQGASKGAHCSPAPALSSRRKAGLEGTQGVVWVDPQP